MSRQISDKSKKITKLLEQGLEPRAILAKGFSWETIRYHYRRLKFPEQYKTHLKNISKYNSNRAKLDKKSK